MTDLALESSATGMQAQEKLVTVLSHNIANINTTAYRRQRVEFQDLMYQTIRQAGSSASPSGEVVPTGIQLGMGVKIGGIYRITEQGAPNQTGNPLDVTINGKGFLIVEMPSGELAYTRAGSLQLSPSGKLVSIDGYTISPGITIPPENTNITINKEGEVSVKLPGQPIPEVVGQISLASFSNEGGLHALGDNLFIETEASGPAIPGTPYVEGFGSIQQGFLESSNVQVVLQISELIAAQRAYEMNAKSMETVDQMMAARSNIR